MACVFGVFVPSIASAQRIPAWHEIGRFSLMTPGAGRHGLFGFQNPAVLAWQDEMDVMFQWSNSARNTMDDHRLGVYVALPGLMFGSLNTKTNGIDVTDHRIATGFGTEAFSFGVGYGWFSGDTRPLNLSNLVTAGALVRASKYFSIGAVATSTSDFNHAELAADLAVRPLGSDRLTIFADIAKPDGQSLKSAAWSAGAMVEPVGGLRVAARYFDTKAFTVGVQISLGRASFESVTAMDDQTDPMWTSYAVRLGSRDRNFFDVFGTPRRYVSLDLKGSVGYQRFILFDNRRTLSEILDWIDNARRDPGVRGIAINTSAFEAPREFLWEIRDRLREFRAAGKRVVMFIDRPSLDAYWLASISDKIVLDPTGMILIPGYAMGRTFYKGTLEKIGIGYDEWRFFTYKSAYENYGRDRMSDADREQRQAYLDDVYAQMRADVAEGRHVAPDTVDAWINRMGLFTPKEALASGLVDTLCRWDDLQKLVTDLEGRNTSLIAAGALEASTMPRDMRWGSRPKIAVIYALGACAMDEGITARTLVHDISRAVGDPSIRAIVLRVDSPGGDPMASDIIAEALRKAKGIKPVIVSQGAVAASGGYWLSMYADTIVAAPMTVTGSIGVIGGWLYDTGLKEKLGMTTDLVKAGAHADLGFGFTLPLIGAGVPDRNLTPEERSVMERMIRSSYADFVAKVAEGRKSNIARIDSVAQGRIWSGTRGSRHGLVDVLGGLHDAIGIARQRAGIGDDERVEIVSLPEPGLIDLSGLLRPTLSLAQRAVDRLTQDLMFRLEHNGQPLMLLPLDDMVVQIPAY